MRFIVHGCRGSRPVSGPAFDRYGGHTTCFSAWTRHAVLAIDAGSGIADLGAMLLRDRHRRPVTILLTHFHLDHLIGLPSFPLLYETGRRITIMAAPRPDADWREDLRQFFSRRFWPMGIDEVPASVTLADLPLTAGYTMCGDMRATWLPVPHPQPCMAYRIESRGASVVTATDAEFDPAGKAGDFVDFCRRADYLFFDGQYSRRQYATHARWGHSSWTAGVAIARAAEVRHLLFIHHDPTHTDRRIDAMVRRVRSDCPTATAARQGMRIHLADRRAQPLSSAPRPKNGGDSA